MRKALISLLLGFALLTGCAMIQQHKGSVSQFDSSTGDALHDLQGVLEGLGDHIADYPQAKSAINDAREYYTLAERTYLQWRCAVGASSTFQNGPCPVTDITQSQVTKALSQAQSKTATAQTQATGGKK